MVRAMTAHQHEEPPVVRARGLTKAYGPLTAVDHVDLRVSRGDVYGLLGPNGAGKTTLMRMIFGLITPDDGQVEIRGVPVQPEPQRALDRVAGFIETPRFYPYLSARKNLQLLSRLDGRPRGDRIDEVLDLVDLSTRADSRVREYSYGMVQRLGVAASLLREPELLVLDEPTNGLDPAGIRDMRNLISRLVDTGLTLLLSSHHMSEVDEICTKVAIMRRGQIAYDGPLDELRQRAGRSTRHLVTSDDHAAADVCRRTDGVVNVELTGSQIVLDADDRTVERLVRDLVAAGIGISAVQAPSSALETLFFRLTESEPSTQTDEEAA
jgi:ABC-2 type transport system ATP-binding protein